ncbi:MAG: SH3 domain-containing protein, partial [Pseudomonadota bacterium]
QVAPSLGGGGAPKLPKQPPPGPVPGATVQPVRTRAPAPKAQPQPAKPAEAQKTPVQPAAGNPAPPTKPEKQS